MGVLSCSVVGTNVGTGVGTTVGISVGTGVLVAVGSTVFTGVGIGVRHDSCFSPHEFSLGCASSCLCSVITILPQPDKMSSANRIRMLSPYFNS